MTSELPDWLRVLVRCFSSNDIDDETPEKVRYGWKKVDECADGEDSLIEWQTPTGKYIETVKNRETQRLERVEEIIKFWKEEQ